LYVVVFILFLSLMAFFINTTEYSQTNELDPFAHIEANEGKEVLGDTLKMPDLSTSGPILTPNESSPQPASNNFPMGFFAVFAIIFPAFTGMTAGVGLSGDLKNPRRSIPMGTLGGTLAGMFIYFLIAYKLAVSASPEDLADTSRLVMADIAWQGWWLIPFGLAAATVSSALGSLMVAPRTLQAIAKDQIFPSPIANYWLSRGKGAAEEPFNATLVTIGIAFIFVLMGELDFVAEIISMFFMVTYGSLCLISFLQHFAADPSYRPTFKSRWYISLFGAIACFGLMLFMNVAYAFLAIVGIVVFYLVVNYYNPDKGNLAVIFQGAIFQLSRQLQVFLQKAEKEKTASWRPSIVCISENSFDRLAAFDLLRWISQKYGFGTYIHKIRGYLSKSTNREAKVAKGRLIKMAETSKSNIYIDTLISPSFTSAIAQVIQLPGISGTDNNLLLFEYSKHKPDNLNNIIDNFKLINSVDFDVILLGSSERGFGFKRAIHIWITASDYENANLMILLGYIIIGHSDWRKSFIKIFAIYPESTCDNERKRLHEIIEDGQLPIAYNNIEVIPRKVDIDTRSVIIEKSRDADLTILGFRGERIKHEGTTVFEGYEEIG
ncbi:MAG: amino acid permease, partial [Bacteroidota bacterium]